MPYESDDDAYNQYTAVLADTILTTEKCPYHCLDIGGDFNVDFTKHKEHSKLLIDDCADNDLQTATLHERYNIDYTYNFCMTRFSFIDHLIVFTAVYEKSIEDCIARDDGDNPSDHDPVMLLLNITCSSIALTKKTHNLNLDFYADD